MRTCVGAETIGYVSLISSRLSFPLESVSCILTFGLYDGAFLLGFKVCVVQVRIGDGMGIIDHVKLISSLRLVFLKFFIFVLTFGLWTERLCLDLWLV